MSHSPTEPDPPTKARLRHLRVRDLRCLKSIDLDLDPDLNVFLGDNGAGKTSLLEAVYLLARGSSFRRGLTRQLIRDGATQLHVSADLSQARVRRLAMLRDRDGTRTQIDGDPCRSLEPVLRALPTTVLEPGLHRVLEDGPILRRQFLDWCVFHVEPQFLDSWRRYARSLRQRNHALRQGDRAGAEAWVEPLAEAGERVAECRRRVVDRLLPLIRERWARLSTVANLDLRFRPGWGAQKADYGEALRESVDGDLERGHTQLGPHRAELAVLLGRHLAREQLSRGQQKLLLAAMVLSQQQLLAESGQAAILLVDDFASELGPKLREALWQELRLSPGQVWLTALERGQLPVGSLRGRMFHVEHGVVEPML